MDVFWVKQISVGPLKINVGRNDGIYKNVVRPASFMFDRLNGQMFLTFRIGTHFLNVDWV